MLSRNCLKVSQPFAVSFRDFIFHPRLTFSCEHARRMCMFGKASLMYTRKALQSDRGEAHVLLARTYGIHMGASLPVATPNLGASPVCQFPPLPSCCPSPAVVLGTEHSWTAPDRRPLDEPSDVPDHPCAGRKSPTMAT